MKITKNKKIFIAAFSTTLSAFLIINTYASSITPGSEGDPLVTKSYVDKKVSELMTILSSNNGSSSSITDAQMEEIITETVKQVQVLTPQSSTQTYVPVRVTNGQILYGGEGTEIILRSGTCNTYITALEGIVNATTGQNLNHDTPVSANNILITPRDDGRGVQVTSPEAWFIVKGMYTIN